MTDAYKVWRRIYLSSKYENSNFPSLLAHRTMWSVTNYFLVNLTLADLMMSILNCIPSFIFMRDRYFHEMLLKVLAVFVDSASKRCSSAAVTFPYSIGNRFMVTIWKKMSLPLKNTRIVSSSLSGDTTKSRIFEANLKLLCETLILTSIYSKNIRPDIFCILWTLRRWRRIFSDFPFNM